MRNKSKKIPLLTYVLYNCDGKQNLSTYILFKCCILWTIYHAWAYQIGIGSYQN